MYKFENLFEIAIQKLRKLVFLRTLIYRLITTLAKYT